MAKLKLNKCCWRFTVEGKYIKRGRANLRCPKCDNDITLPLIMAAQAKEEENE